MCVVWRTLCAVVGWSSLFIGCRAMFDVFGVVCALLLVVCCCLWILGCCLAASFDDCCLVFVFVGCYVMRAVVRRLLFVVCCCL